MQPEQSERTLLNTRTESRETARSPEEHEAQEMAERAAVAEHTLACITYLFTTETPSYAEFAAQHPIDPETAGGAGYYQGMIANYQNLTQRARDVEQRYIEQLGKKDVAPTPTQLGEEYFRNLYGEPHGTVLYERVGAVPQLTIMVKEDYEQIIELQSEPNESPAAHALGAMLPKIHFPLEDDEVALSFIIVNGSDDTAAPEDYETVRNHEVAHFLYNTLFEIQKYSPQQERKQTEAFKDEVIAFLFEGADAETITDLLPYSISSTPKLLPDTKLPKVVLRRITLELALAAQLQTRERKQLLACALLYQQIDDFPRIIRGLNAHYERIMIGDVKKSE